jgi:hypothetical protein
MADDTGNSTHRLQNGMHVVGSGTAMEETPARQLGRSAARAC